MIDAWKQWLSLGSWPAGPAWFLWVLLAFGCVVATVYAIAPNAIAAIGRLSGRLAARPIALFGVLVIGSALVYLPMAAAFTPIHWVKAGPFFVQISRLLLYAVYFFIGAAFGSFGVDRGIFTSFACLAVFLRFARKSNRIVDNLSANAFGIYLLHYFCVSWLQLALLDAPMSGAAKGTSVVIGALLASWAMSAAFRSVRQLARGTSTPALSSEA